MVVPCVIVCLLAQHACEVSFIMNQFPKLYIETHYSLFLTTTCSGDLRNGRQSHARNPPYALATIVNRLWLVLKALGHEPCFKE